MSPKEWMSLALAAVMVAGPLAALPARAQEAKPAEAAPPDFNKHKAAAVAGDVLFSVPGKVITCTGSLVFWVVAMGVTFGTVWDEAARMVKGGCGGKWVHTEEDIKRSVADPPDR